MSLSPANLLFAGVLWLLWRLWKIVAIKSPVKNLAGPPASSWFAGNLIQLNNPDGLSFNHKILDEYGGAAKIHGLLGDEQIYFSDPLAFRHITLNLKDQLIFDETRVFREVNRVIFGDSLAAIHGAHHKKQRKILNPVFSSTHMRALVPIVSDIAFQLSQIIEEKVRHDGGEINMLDQLWRAAIEILGQAGLGHSFESLDETKSDSYTDSVKNIFPTLDKLGLALFFVPLLSKLGTPSFRRRIVDLIPWETLQDFKQLVDIMDQKAHEVFAERRAALVSGPEDKAEKVGKGKDIMALLLQANESASEADRLPENEVVSLINLLIFASSDTTSGTLSKVLEQLAKYPEVQTKLREEAIEAMPDHTVVSYEKLNGLLYLDAVIKETLRLYPSVVKMERTASQDVTVPLHIPVRGTDGQMISEILVAKNQNVILSIANCNRDIRIWGSDADEWKPERWLVPLPESLKEARIPGVFPNLMTFLAGDRACIGYSFGLMEMKVVLLTLITKFHFGLTDKNIEWKIGATQYPLVTGEQGSQLPLKVSLV